MKRLFTATLVALLLLTTLWFTPRVALASAPIGVFEDKIIFGDSYTLKDGETIDGSLVVFGGNVTIENGGKVKQNIVVFGGNVEISGDVNGDVVVFGGNADLKSTAVVDGRLVTSGGNITRAEGAEVNGGETQGFDGTNGPSLIPRPIVSDTNPFLMFLMQIAQVIGGAIVMGLFALLVVVFLPEHTARVSAAALGTPLPAGGIGFITYIAAPIIIVATAITLCLIPFSLLIGFALVVASMFGTIALGAIVGARLATGLRLYSISPALSAAGGTTLLTFLLGVINLVPCIGWIPGFLLGCLGLGAVMLTRFGTQPYITSGPAMSAPPPMSPPPADMPPPPPPPPAPDMSAGDAPMA